MFGRVWHLGRVSDVGRGSYDVRLVHFVDGSFAGRCRRGCGGVLFFGGGGGVVGGGGGGRRRRWRRRRRRLSDRGGQLRE